MFIVQITALHIYYVMSLSTEFIGVNYLWL